MSFFTWIIHEKALAHSLIDKRFRFKSKQLRRRQCKLTASKQSSARFSICTTSTNRWIFKDTTSVHSHKFREYFFAFKSAISDKLNIQKPARGIQRQFYSTHSQQITPNSVSQRHKIKIKSHLNISFHQLRPQKRQSHKPTSETIIRQKGKTKNCAHFETPKRKYLRLSCLRRREMTRENSLLSNLFVQFGLVFVSFSKKKKTPCTTSGHDKYLEREKRLQLSLRRSLSLHVWYSEKVFQICCSRKK